MSNNALIEAVKAVQEICLLNAVIDGEILASVAEIHERLDGLERVED